MLALTLSLDPRTTPFPAFVSRFASEPRRATRLTLASVARGKAVFAPAASACIVARVPIVRIEPAIERDLCDRAKRGDRAALGKILRTYGPVIFRAVLLPRLGSVAVAEDALSETYARVVERFDRYEWQDCGVYPWLRVVAMRIALDILRAKKRETLFEPDDLAREIDSAEKEGSARPTSRCSKRAIATLRARRSKRRSES